MATNLDLDPELVERAVALSGAPTKKAAVTAALQEFIARREQRRLLELFGKLEWDPAYDYKRERSRGLSLFVDTSVWSLALRRDRPADVPEVGALERALAGGELVVTTGLVYQELLQGFHGPRDQQAIVARFAALPFLTPDRHDHFEAAQLRNRARRRGVQIGTIDAVLAQLCIRYELRLLTTDADFARIAEHEPLERWTP